MSSRFRLLSPLIISLGGLAVTAPAALALPSFSDQTGQPCTSCHIGGFGPQLTPYGRQFKAEGYTGGTADRQFPLLSAMLETSHTTVAKGVPGGLAPGFNNNNAFAIDQGSIFIAGRIYDGLGIFSQTTWDGIGHSWSWDNTDLRYAHDVQIGTTDALIGLSLNNNPTVSDLFNTTPAWGYPYAASGLAPTPGAATLIEGGLAGRVLGITGYALLDDHFYLEGGAYLPLGANALKNLGVAIADGPQISGAAPYGRFAYSYDTTKQSVEVGAFAMSAAVYPGNDRTTGSTDKFRDFGLDASYQWLGDRKNIFTLNASAIFEKQSLDATYALGGAAKAEQSLTSLHLNGSYTYDQSYGLTLGGFKVSGSRDALLYGSDSLTGSPNSAGYIVELDWTPFGKKDSPLAPWANLRLGLQYVGYTEFDGRAKNYDGSGRNASDNNTLWLLAWWAF